MEYCTRTRSGYIIVIEICGALAVYSASEFCIRPRRERSLSDLLYTAYNVHMCSRAFTCRYYKLDKVARALFFGGIAAAAYLAWLVAAAAVE
ncbi:unnamed protein product [Trichogramma brassicae]|uniref:Uncharacterized protein n=1 Tax=Trichogramma brassicae TaxID=86971 RepID=A0A6H5I207_9HYME|nr:unnamed protein product [Trichogramma brassicae]CAB0030562.1 unnamed protein product [Trichogramma brassicae]CAB0030564.1 unnamed protein product [Trichogramma brassicae]